MVVRILLMNFNVIMYFTNNLCCKTISDLDNCYKHVINISIHHAELQNTCFH